MAFIQVNEKTYINPDNVQKVSRINNECSIYTTYGAKLDITEELFEEIKEYEHQGGGSGKNLVFVIEDILCIVDGKGTVTDATYTTTLDCYVEGDTLYITTEEDK